MSAGILKVPGPVRMLLGGWFVAHELVHHGALGPMPVLHDSVDEQDPIFVAEEVLAVAAIKNEKLRPKATKPAVPRTRLVVFCTTDQQARAIACGSAVSPPGRSAR